MTTALAVAACGGPGGQASGKSDLWQVYQDSLASAKYIDLSHVIAPVIPVWYGFGPSRFGQSVDPATCNTYTYGGAGFEASRYELAIDQLGTQFDPPAHWAAEYPSIDEIPATYKLRPLVVISIVPQLATDAGYHLHVADIEA